MLIPFSLRTDNEHVIVAAPQENIHLEIDNALVYARSKQRVDVYLDVGNASADPVRLLAQSGFVPENFSARLIHPFRVDDFSPKFTAAFAQYCVAVAYQKIRRHPGIARLADRSVLELAIKGYETLSEDVQQEFVYRLRKTFPLRLYRLIINERDTAHIHHEQRFASILVTIFSGLYGLAFAMCSMALFNGIGPATWRDAWSSLGFPLFGIAVIVCFIGGANFGALLAALVLRRFTPKVSLKIVLLNSDWLPKATINCLTSPIEMARFND